MCGEKNGHGDSPVVYGSESHQLGQLVDRPRQERERDGQRERSMSRPKDSRVRAPSFVDGANRGGQSAQSGMLRVTSESMSVCVCVYVVWCVSFLWVIVTLTVFQRCLVCVCV